MTRLPALLLLPILLLATPVLAATESATQQRLEAARQQLQAEKARSTALARQADTLGSEVKDLQERLVSTTAEADRAGRELDELESNLADLEGTAARRTALLASQRQHMSETLALLQRLALTPPAAQLFSGVPPLDQVRTNLQLRALLPQIEQNSAEIAATVADLRLLQQRLEEKRQEARRTQEKLTLQQSELNRLMDERNRRLQATQKDYAATQQKSQALAQEARDLGDLLTRMQAEQRQREAQDAAKADTQVTPVSTPPARMLPSASYRRLPLSAPIVLRFGHKDPYGTTSKGVVLRPRPGAAVSAIASGKVIFAGPFRGYGNVLIVEHKGQYHTVMTGLGRVTVSVGQQVATGEPLGTVFSRSDPPPDLYFEVRYNDVSIDPLGEKAAQLTQSSSR